VVAEDMSLWLLWEELSAGVLCEAPSSSVVP
jgi:hypothetical protein